MYKRFDSLYILCGLWRDKLFLKLQHECITLPHSIITLLVFSTSGKNLNCFYTVPSLSVQVYKKNETITMYVEMFIFDL